MYMLFEKINFDFFSIKVILFCYEHVLLNDIYFCMVKTVPFLKASMYFI